MNILKRIIPLRIRKFIRNGREAFRFVNFKRKVKKATPVLVYQMGKVGSKSIHSSLCKQYKGLVVHAHILSQSHSNCYVRLLYQWVVLEKKPLYVISLVREPIGRNISAFFQNFERDTGVSPSEANFSVDELSSIFLSNYRHEVPLEWFDKWVKPLLGIDVFATPFPPDGIAAYANKNIKLLVMRSENSDAEKSQAIKKFLGLPSLQILNTNIGKEKVYAPLYEDFKNKAALPSDYIEKMCQSQYFKHFYSKEEIEASRKKWNKTNR